MYSNGRRGQLGDPSVHPGLFALVILVSLIPGPVYSLEGRSLDSSRVARLLGVPQDPPVADDGAPRVRCHHRTTTAAVRNRVEGDLIRYRSTHADELARLNAPAAQVTGTPTTTIPVHFHIITTEDGNTGQVADERIHRQMEVLNQAFRGALGGAATPFRFQLASTDRTARTTWYEMAMDSAAEFAAKSALRRGGAGALEIYTTGTNELGFSEFPWDARVGRDGVVVRYSSLPGGGLPRFDEGKTAVHEVGHWLGLYHTFEGACALPGDCVDDTPAEATPANGCPGNRDSCPLAPGVDPIHNYMDYADDACMTQFSPGQTVRMILAHSKFRLVRR